MALVMTLTGEPKKVNGSTVRESIINAGYSPDSFTVQVNRQPATLDQQVTEYDVIVLSQQVKGGM